MKTRILFVALGIAWVIALAGLVWMMTLAQLRPHHALLLLIHLNFVLKTCVVLSVVSAAIGILSLRAGARPRPWIGVGGALGGGALGGLYGAAGAQSGLINMNPPDPLRHVLAVLRRGPHRPADRPDRRAPLSRPAQPSKAPPRLTATASAATRSVHAFLHPAYAPLSPGCSATHRAFSRA